MPKKKYTIEDLLRRDGRWPAWGMWGGSATLYNGWEVTNAYKVKVDYEVTGTDGSYILEIGYPDA